MAKDDATRVNRAIVAERDKPRVVGIKRAPHCWKWKVYTYEKAPEFTVWEDAYEFACEYAASF